jgi:hypothetical protein
MRRFEAEADIAGWYILFWSNHGIRRVKDFF